MISIIKEVIDPLTQAAIWGTAAYLGSKAGAKKAKSAVEEKEQKHQHMKQAAIGAGAGGLGAIGVSGLKKGYEYVRKAIDKD